MLGRGSLSMKGYDFISERKSTELRGSSAYGKIKTATSFAGNFASQLSVPFISSLGQLQWPSSDTKAPGDTVAPSQTYSIQAVDGVKSALVMWDPLLQKDATLPTSSLYHGRQSTTPYLPHRLYLETLLRTSVKLGIGHTASRTEPVALSLLVMGTPRTVRVSIF